MRIVLPHDWQTPEKFAKRLGDDVGRQRVMSTEGHLLLVLHEPPPPGIAPRVGRYFWRDAEGNWRSKPLGDGVQALKRHVAEFAERAEELEKDCLEADSAGVEGELGRAQNSRGGSGDTAGEAVIARKLNSTLARNRKVAGFFLRRYNYLPHVLS